MKNARKAKSQDEMLPEYDFRNGVRGKYSKRFATGTNIVILSPDVAKAFPDSEAVNKALRSLIKSTAQVARQDWRQKFASGYFLFLSDFSGDFSAFCSFNLSARSRLP